MSNELQEGTGWLDYGARMYNPNLGTFHTQDPCAESYYSYSPYNYVGCNPIIRVDENGEFWNYVVGALVGAATDYAFQVAVNVVENGWSSDAFTDVDTGSIALSAGAGALGVGIASGFSKLANVGKLAKHANSKVGKVVTNAVSDATSSVIGTAVQGNNITAEGIILDIVTGGVVGNPTKSATKKMAQNSTKGKALAKKAQVTKSRNKSNTGRNTSVSKKNRMNKNYQKQKTRADNFGKKRAMAAGSAGAGAASKTVNRLREEK